MVNVLAYTGGWNSPSRIFRVQQYQEPLRKFDINVRESPSWAGVYPPDRKWLRPAWGGWNLFDRIPDTLRSFGYDLVFLQREMMSTFVTWEPLTKRPRIFDVDDAIWVHRGGHFARKLAALSDHVICGNQFLADQFSCWNPSVSILPTPVDTERFFPQERSGGERRPVIGWMGLAVGFEYLYGVERALRHVLCKYPDALLRIVSSRRPHFRILPPEQVQWIPWTSENEARTMQDMTIGIMPLDDTVGSRGKCSYKMLLYMASGLPVVVSAVGMNSEVLELGNVGYGVSSEDEWIENLSHLLENPGLSAAMGKVGREVVVKHYSIQSLVPRLAKTILDVAGKAL